MARATGSKKRKTATKKSAKARAQELAADNVRLVAQNRLSDLTLRGSVFSGDGKTTNKALRSELAVYQMELELQNLQLREAQASLEQIRSWYTSLFELAPVPYIILKPDHSIKELNFAAAQLLATDRLRCQAARLALFVDGDSRQSLWAHFEEVFHGALGQAKRVLIRLRGHHGSHREVELHSFLVEHSANDDPSCLTICFDVTERNRTLYEMEHARRQAEAAAVAKAEFLSNMSHEMRTPLTAIKMFAQMVRRPSFDTEKKDKYLGNIVRSAEHLNGLIGDILDVARADADKIKIALERTDTRVLVRDVIDTLMPLAIDRGLELTATIDDRVPHEVLVDPVRLKQILINLMGNSLKFTRAGAVSIQVGVEPGAESSMLSMLVRDTGIGIPPQRKAQLFSQFYQVDGSTTRPQGGTGLGLYLSRKLARLMGGDVELVSTVLGQGSVFCVSIPLKLP